MSPMGKVELIYRLFPERSGWKPSMVLRWPPFLGVLIAALLSWPSVSDAYDTGGHSDITRDAMLAEGFSPTAADVAVVNNFFVDYYTNNEKNPFSGQAPWYIQRAAYVTDSMLEHWWKSTIDGAQRLHWDSTIWDVRNSQKAEAEWNRIQRVTKIALNGARGSGVRRTRKLLAIIGISLHQVQDFYSHTNWAEHLPGIEGADGPDWQQMGFGSTPTWFDVPKVARDSVSIYAGNMGPRRHGSWDADNNQSKKTGVNMDWPGRPGYPAAYMSAYFATRQWLRAIRLYLADEVLWQQMTAYADRSGVDWDLNASVWIPEYTGHWQGQGELSFNGPLGGDAIGARNETLLYHGYGPNGEGFPVKTTLRADFESLVPQFADATPASAPGDLLPITGTRSIQAATAFVKLSVTAMGGAGPSPIGDPLPLDEADLYVRSTIAGQGFQSGVINGRDSFEFPLPYAAPAFFKSVERGSLRPETVQSMTVEVRTADESWAGTDDTVKLCISSSHCFPLDKSLYNDFERGDRDTYSVPVDEAVLGCGATGCSSGGTNSRGRIYKGLTTNDLSEVRIIKSPDGVGGAWKLGGIKLMVNGRTVYQNNNVNKWLKGGSRTWKASNFAPGASLMSTDVPITLDLWDSDSNLYGDDDHGDLNRYDARKREVLTFSPSTNTSSVTGAVYGGRRLGGRMGDGDTGYARYIVNAWIPIVPSIKPPPPGGGGGDVFTGGGVHG